MNVDRRYPSGNKITSEQSGCPQNSCPQNSVFPPRPKRAQNEEELYKISRNFSRIDTFPGEHNSGHLGVSDSIQCKMSLK